MQNKTQILDAQIFVKDKPPILVLMGGQTEREVSLMSGKNVCEALHAQKKNYISLDPGFDLVNSLLKLKPAVVFNALHGGIGENGTIPGLLDSINMPYTHSGISTSALFLNKHLTRLMAQRALKIKMPKAKLLHKKHRARYSVDPLPRPYIIKPLDQGSSVGIELIKLDTDFDFRQYHWNYGDKIIVEEFILGKEVNVAFWQGRAMGAMEFRPRADYRDYYTKYNAETEKQIMPPELSQQTLNCMFNTVNRLARLVDCKDIARADFIVDQNEVAYLLELNTHPGLSKLSIFPRIMQFYHALNFTEIVNQLIANAQCPN